MQKQALSSVLFVSEYDLHGAGCSALQRGRDVGCGAETEAGGVARKVRAGALREGDQAGGGEEGDSPAGGAGCSLVLGACSFLLLARRVYPLTVCASRHACFSNLDRLVTIGTVEKGFPDCRRLHIS